MAVERIRYVDWPCGPLLWSGTKNLEVGSRVLLLTSRAQNSGVLGNETKRKRRRHTDAGCAICSRT